MRRAAVCSALLIALVACGGRGPLAPTDPSDDARSGILTICAARAPQKAVAGASVIGNDGILFVTGLDGTVTLPARYIGKAIEINAAGHVQPRRVIFQSGMTDYLLPDDNQLPYAWLKTAYYADDAEQVLWRPEPGLIAMELGPQVLADGRAVAAVQHAIEVINQAQSNVTYFLVQSGGRIRMYLDPDDSFFDEHPEAWAFIDVTTENHVIVKARIVWKFFTRPGTNDADFLWHAVAHELCHHTGIWGHPPGGIMGAAWGVTDFSAREKEAMAYAFLRIPGTRAPDDSTGTLSAPLTHRLQAFVPVPTMQ